MSSLWNNRLEELVVGEKYKLIKKIGSGAFGLVYLAANKTNKNELVAVKLERKLAGERPLLWEEYNVYRILGGGGAAIPQIKWFGKNENRYDLNVLVMELLGSSLENCFEDCSRRFSVKTVLMLADQLLHTLEFVHDRSYLHRDIKPENFAVCLGQQCHKVYMIDFGFAKPYRDPWSRRHIPFSKHHNLVGTANYVSVNVHEGFEQSRRDDLEALGYMLIYFLRGALPWKNVRARDKKEKYNKIKELKISTSIMELCQDLPSEFKTYLHYCRHLRFEETPNYRYLRELFQKLFKQQGFQNDFKFDWPILQTKDETLNVPTST